MKDEKIKGGCVLLARQLLKSEIWQKPPEYLKVFILILLNVNHSDTSLFPKGSNFFNFSHVSIPGVSQNQIYDFLRWAANSGVLTKQKTKRGVILKLNNYGYFQLLENYKFQNTFQQFSETINKKGNNVGSTIPYLEEYKLSHEVIKGKDCKQSEREKFSFSKEDYEILKNFAKKHSKNNFWAYLRSLQRDFEGAQNIISEEKRRAEILKNQKIQQQQEESESDFEDITEHITNRDDAIRFLVEKNKNLKMVNIVPQYKKLAEKFKISMEDLKNFINRT